MATSRRDFLRRAAIGVAAGSLMRTNGLFAQVAPSTQTARAPNIVIILADDLGYGDVRCYDPEFCKVDTPNIDRLAAQGMRFTDAHSACAVCTPTRYGLLTGRFSWRTKLQRGVLKKYDPPLIDADRLTLPAMLKQQGYHTAIVGKWHLGMDWPRKDGKIVFDQPFTNGPTARGFDYYFGTDVPNYPPFTFIENDRVTPLPTDYFDRNGKGLHAAQAREWGISQEGEMAPGWKFDQILPGITAKATQYIDQHAKEQAPFFLFFSLTTPHTPLTPSERSKGKSSLGVIGDMIMDTDWAVGEVMQALERNGIADNTLLIFTSDNGDASLGYAKDRGGHRMSGPFRGHKHQVYEGGHRVPFIARWPGMARAGSSCDQLICLNDLFASCAELTATKLPAEAGLDSVSMLSLLKGSTQPVRESLVVHSGPGQFGIREGKWSLAIGPDPDAPPENRPKVQLYDLSTDIGQKINLQDKHPDIVQRLTATLDRAVAEGRSTPGPKQPNDVPVNVWANALPKPATQPARIAAD